MYVKHLGQCLVYDKGHREEVATVIREGGDEFQWKLDRRRVMIPSCCSSSLAASPDVLLPVIKHRCLKPLASSLTAHSGKQRAQEGLCFCDTFKFESNKLAWVKLQREGVGWIWAGVIWLNLLAPSLIWVAWEVTERLYGRHSNVWCDKALGGTQSLVDAGTRESRKVSSPDLLSSSSLWVVSLSWGTFLRDGLSQAHPQDGGWEWARVRVCGDLWAAQPGLFKSLEVPAKLRKWCKISFTSKQSCKNITFPLGVLSKAPCTWHLTTAFKMSAVLPVSTLKSYYYVNRKYLT